MKNLSLQDRLRQSPFQGYTYAYPHKLAYRPFAEPLALSDLWADEKRNALFFYLHLPFCEMRCGFCNLFTTAHPDQDLVDGYLRALDGQMACMAEAMGGGHRFARGAIGGGTPTFLTAAELERLFAAIARRLGHFPREMSLSVEMSPSTATDDRLALLKNHGTTRASLGVQSFLEPEVRSLGRRQSSAEVHRALEAMRRAGFPMLNVDLIYGIEGQTASSWRDSLQQALAHQPEEFYLYPLYVRPLTGLARRGGEWQTYDGAEARAETGDQRLALYRQARDLLQENGYRQISLRHFRRQSVVENPSADGGPGWSCQEDGMVGLGAGARSYTARVHYSSEYAVGRAGVMDILRDFVAAPPASHACAQYGVHLTLEDQKRRFVMKSLLRVPGLSNDDYQMAFGSSPGQDFPQLRELTEAGLARQNGDLLSLTPAGLERADTIGPWLVPEEVTERMEAFALV